MTKQVPRHVVQAAIAIAAAQRRERACTRCDGEGVREDSPTWVVVKKGNQQGKVCFRCHGSGKEPQRVFVDPFKVRYAVANQLLPLVRLGDVRRISILEARAQVRDALFWPVLQDVYAKARAVAAQNSQPQDDDQDWDDGFDRFEAWD